MSYFHEFQRVVFLSLEQNQQQISQFLIPWLITARNLFFTWRAFSSAAWFVNNFISNCLKRDRSIPKYANRFSFTCTKIREKGLGSDPSILVMSLENSNWMGFFAFLHSSAFLFKNSNSSSEHNVRLIRTEESHLLADTTRLSFQQDFLLD